MQHIQRVVIQTQALEFHLHIKLLCSSSAHQILMICHGPLNLITMHKVPSADLQCKAVCVSIRQADIARCGLQCRTMPRGGWRVTETTSNSQSRDHASFVMSVLLKKYENLRKISIAYCENLPSIQESSSYNKCCCIFTMLSI